jgi:hypothetical protein
MLLSYKGDYVVWQLQEKLIYMLKEITFKMLFLC